MVAGRVIVAGGGFGGVKCARTLRKLLPEDYEIIVFNSENHMVFHPLLAEVAGGAIQPKDVAAPLRQMLHGVRCRTEEIVCLDIKNSAVEYESHDGRRKSLAYDHLVIACGSTVNLGLVPGMDEHAFALKTVGDALALQAQVMEQLEKAEVCDDPERKRWYLSFVIVGAGFSGVELAGEINDLLRRSLQFFHNIKASDISVSLIHAGDEILPQISPALRQFARKRLEAHGVTVMLNSVAAVATPQGIGLKDGTFIKAGTVVCTIGNTTLPIIQRLDVPKSNGRLVTEADLSLPGFTNVWAIGDCAAIINAADGALSPPMAQFAERQGTQAAANIAATIRGAATQPFSYRMMGQMCSIGGHSAVAEVMGLRLSGFIAWFIWRSVYLMKLPSLAMQIKVGLEWGFELLFPRTLAHLKANPSRRVGRAYYPAGDYVFRQGDPASDFYVIESGEVEILSDQNNEKEEIIAVLGAGDFFGEAALLDSRARSASVRARTDLELTVLGRSVFSQISTSLLPLRDAMASAMKRRTNIWKNLHEVRDTIAEISLKEMLEPLPHEPITGSCKIADLLERLNKNRLDFCIVVNDEKELIGIVTRSDLFRAIEVAAANGSKMNVCVADIMVKEPITLSLAETTATALSTMREHGLKTLPVLGEGNTRIVKGYVRVENIMQALVKRIIEERKTGDDPSSKQTAVQRKPVVSRVEAD
jgi:NADH dehydrogenase